jgi:hypothetical protein
MRPVIIPSTGPADKLPKVLFAASSGLVNFVRPVDPGFSDSFLHPTDDNPRNTVMLTSRRKSRRKSPFNLFSSYHFFSPPFYLSKSYLKL